VNPDGFSRISRLLQIYGSLLTPRQLLLARTHIVEGKSFAAAARELGVSRQAVHDAVRHVIALLEDYETNLNIMALRDGQPQLPISANHAMHRIEALRKRVAQQGIIYSADWIVRDLNEIIHLLAAEQQNIASVKDDVEH